MVQPIAQTVHLSLVLICGRLNLAFILTGAYLVGTLNQYNTERLIKGGKDLLG